MIRRNPLASISVRLALSYAAVFGLSVVVLGMVVFWGMRAALEQQLRRHVETDVTQLLGDYRDDGLNELRHDIRERREADVPERLFYVLRSPDGRQIFDSLPTLPPVPGWHSIPRTAPQSSGWLLRTVALADGYTLGVAADRGQIVVAEQAVLKAFAATFLATLLAALAGGIWLSRRFLRPIAMLRRTTDRIGRDNLRERLPVRGSGDELDRLALVINALLERLEQLVDEIRHVTSAVAHDLRTPLGHVRQTIDAAMKSTDPKSFLARAVLQIDGVLQTFEAILRLTEVESGVRRAGFVSFNMTEMVQRIAETYQIMAEENGQELVRDLAPGIYWQGDKPLLAQLLVNLLENAVQYAGKGAVLSVRLTPDTLTVSDTGPGVPPEILSRLTQPFYRGERSRAQPGNGLGLTLVAAIARLHDGQLMVRNQQPGFAVTLTCGATSPPAGR